MGLAQNDEMINALTADRPNLPFGKSVLQRRDGHERGIVTLASFACR
jgi:hypothetical protein